MKFAIPTANGQLCMHFGHCAEFALIDADLTTKTITGREMIVPPPHEPGLLPPWLADKGVSIVIAGGMGQRAVTLFVQSGIQVIAGAPSESPEALVTRYLDGTLVQGVNTCDH